MYLEHKESDTKIEEEEKNKQLILNNIKLNKDIAEWLEIKNVRSISNFLHGDFNLSEEKRRKADELVLRYKDEAMERIYTIF